MSRLRTANGTLGDRFPYLRVGDGPRTLVVLPGFGDAMFPGWYPPGIELALAPYFQPYLDEYSVYLLSRPRRLPDGYTIRESAADHADVLRKLGPVDILGISMGGLIGQQLCAHHPDVVDRFVAVSSAYQLGKTGREPVQRMLEYARNHDWASIRSELARGMFSDARSITYPPFIQTVGRFVLPRPAAPDDVRISLEAILEYDGQDVLEEIDHSTLVIGGDRDPYFTADVMRETAEVIPDARLSLLSGGKHGVFHERKATFDRRTTSFLAR